MSNRAWAMIYAAVGVRLAIFCDRGAAVIRAADRRWLANRLGARVGRQGGLAAAGARTAPGAGQDMPMVRIHQEYQESVRQSDKSLKRPSR